MKNFCEYFKINLFYKFGSGDFNNKKYIETSTSEENRKNNPQNDNLIIENGINIKNQDIIIKKEESNLEEIEFKKNQITDQNENSNKIKEPVSFSESNNIQEKYDKDIQPKNSESKKSYILDLKTLLAFAGILSGFGLYYLLKLKK